VLGATRYSSGASLAAAAAAPVLSGLILGWNAIAFAVLAMTALIFYRHRANIRRLLAGTESRVGSRG
jgi:glycerol-3-phosphate acyltransferase PlsY